MKRGSHPRMRSVTACHVAGALATRAGCSATIVAIRAERRSLPVETWRRRHRRAHVGEQLAEVDRLDEVMLEPGGVGALAVGVLAIAGERDQARGREARIRAEPARDLVAVHHREAD